MFDWNDVKALLAVARGGSTAAAARELGVNQTTVARRLEALERDLDMRLVERLQTGASLTEAGLGLVTECEAMERAAQALKQKVEAHRRGVSGTLRVTLSEMTAISGVTPLLGEFRELYPDVTLELVITDDLLDVEAGQADIAFRGASALPDSNLVARKISKTYWALYCSRDYATRMGVPASPANLVGHVLIGGTDEPQTIPGLRQILEQAPGVAPTLKSTSITNRRRRRRPDPGLPAAARKPGLHLDHHAAGTEGCAARARLHRLLRPADLGFDQRVRDPRRRGPR